MGALRFQHVLLLLVALWSFGSTNRVSAAEPTLARLSFWVAPAQMEAFEITYQQQLVPLLQQHRLKPWSEPGAVTVDSVFSQLFVFADPKIFAASKDSLWGDPAWSDVRQRLGTSFYDEAADSIRCQFVFYRVPTRAAPSVPMGSGLRQGDWLNFSVQDGLPSSVVGSWDMLQDRTGQLWFTVGWPQNPIGVVRYDGATFTHFSPAVGLSGAPLAMLEDDNGHLWFGTDRGISRYDGAYVRAFTAADGVVGGAIQSMAEGPDGVLWFGSDQGLGRFDGDKFTAFTGADGLADEGVYVLGVDQKGDLWCTVGEIGGIGWQFGCEGCILTRYDGQRFSRYTSPAALTNVTSMVEDRDGQLWFGTGRGLVHYDGQSFTPIPQGDRVDVRIDVLGLDRQGHLWCAAGERNLIRYDGQGFTPFAIPGRRWILKSMVEEDNGHLWFALMRGMLRFDGQKFTHFTTENGLRQNAVLTAIADRQGYVWVGTMGGLSRYDGTHVSSFTPREGLPDPYVFAGLQDRRGHLWFGSGHGFGRYDGEQWDTIALEGGGFSDSMVEDRHGHLWFGGREKSYLVRYDGGDFTTIPLDAQLTATFSNQGLAVDRDNQLWVATQQGVRRYDSRDFTRFTKEDGLLSDAVSVVAQGSAGHMWFGTPIGASRFDGQAFTSFTHANGLGFDGVAAIAADQEGYIWFGGNNAVSRYDGESFRTFTVADGLKPGEVNAILCDRRGHLWFGSYGAGIVRYDGQVFQDLHQRDGLVADTVHDLFEDRDGSVWITTDSGVSRYRPSTALPGIRLNEIIADRAYRPEETVRLPSSQGLVSFQFQGGSLTTSPQRLVYVYRLLGREEEWQWTRANQVRYAQLPVGHYTFEVKAVDRDFNYSAHAATVALEVYPQTFTSPVRLEALELKDLFASFYKSYTNQALGTVRVANDAAQAVEAILRYELPGILRQPFEEEFTLAPSSTQEIAIKAVLAPAVLHMQETLPVQSEIELEYRLEEKIASLKERSEITLYGRGALRWDQVGRAAAFITSEDPTVAAFARKPLVAFETQIKSLGRPGQNPLRAMVLFEALKQYGIRYLADANTPYGQIHEDQLAIDHIQYPAEVLQSKAGDCDDLTVLYCSLLENAGIPTALVDYPDHIFLLFDTGVTRQQAYQFPLGETQFLLRGDRLWIPLEISRIEQTFHQAWQAGVHQVDQLPELELRSRLVDTATAWQQFPATAPAFEVQVSAPEQPLLEPGVADQYDALKTRIDTYIDDQYLDPLKQTPGNNALRTQLLKVYLALHQFDTAIRTAQDYLLNEQGDQGRTYNQLGIANALKGDLWRAALHFKLAVEFYPEDTGIQGNLEQALEALGRGTAGGSKAAAATVEVESFYWIE